MTLSPLFEEGESAFKFQSMFRYSKVPESDCYDDDLSKEAKGSNIARGVIMSLVYAVFIATLPLSIWFCLKKVNTLERCIIFRLGKRMPLKGPGLVVTFPCIDVVDTIDLTPQVYTVVLNEQMLTSDGSVVKIEKFDVTISVANAIKSFTQLKDSKSNVQQFIKLSFMNLIASSHVEDLERKTDWILKQYVINCSNHTLKWGWDVSYNETPKLVVISRAEQTNPLVSALKSYLNPGQSQSNAENAIINLFAGERTAEPSASRMTYTNLDGNDPFLSSLKTISHKYSTLGMLGYSSIKLQITVQNQTPPDYFYTFETKTGDVERLTNGGVEDVKLKISAATIEDALEFITKEDTSRVQVQNKLF